MTQTNTTIVKKLAREFEDDPMAQLVINTALNNYLDAVASMDPAKEPEGWTPMVNWKAWHEATVRVKTYYNAQYDRQRTVTND